MPRERRPLTAAIAGAIDAYGDKHPDVTVGEIVCSLLAVWRTLWRALPAAGEKGDGTRGKICEPPPARLVFPKTPG